VYLGKIVEMAPSGVLYESHQHPYTRSLLSAIPMPDPTIEQAKAPFSLTGETTSPINPPPGCRFFSRCPSKKDICEKETPKLTEIAKDHYIACFLME
jgi:oligopeptide transport system ATP-binding protein